MSRRHTPLKSGIDRALSFIIVLGVVVAPLTVAANKQYTFKCNTHVNECNISPKRHCEGYALEERRAQGVDEPHHPKQY